MANMKKILLALLMILSIGCSSSSSTKGTPENDTVEPSSSIETTDGITQPPEQSSESTTSEEPTSPTSDDTTVIPGQEPELNLIPFKPTYESRWNMACYTDGADQLGRFMGHLMNASYIDLSLEAMVTSRGSGTCAAGYPALFVTDDNELIQAIAFMDGFEYGCNVDCEYEITYFPNDTDYNPWTWYRIRVIIDMINKVQYTWVDNIYLGEIVLPYTGSKIVSYQAAGGSYIGNIIFMIRNVEISISEI